MIPAVADAELSIVAAGSYHLKDRELQLDIGQQIIGGTATQQIDWYRELG